MCLVHHGRTPSNSCTTGSLTWASRMPKPTPLLRKRPSSTCRVARILSLACSAPNFLELAEDITDFALSPDEQAAVSIEKTEQGSRLTLIGSISQETIDRLAKATKSPDVRAAIESEAKRHRAVWQAYLSPAQRGVPFHVPQLCFMLDGELELADRRLSLMRRAGLFSIIPLRFQRRTSASPKPGVQWEIDLNATGKIKKERSAALSNSTLTLSTLAGRNRNCAGGSKRRRARQTSPRPCCLNSCGVPSPKLPYRTAGSPSLLPGPLALYSVEGSRGKNLPLPRTGKRRALPANPVRPAGRR